MTVHRRKLLEDLHLSLGTELLVIDAPAGWGKTTLVHQFAEELAKDVYWISLDAESSPAEAIDGFHRDRAQLAQKGWSAAPSWQMASGRGLSEEIIIIDDVHRLLAAEAGAARLAELIEELPAGLTLMLLGRGINHRLITQRVAEGTALLLTKEALKFDGDELQSLAEGAGVEVDLDAIEDEAGGWPAGCASLVGFAAESQADRDGALSIAGEWDQYIDCEVLSGIRPESEAPLKALCLTQRVDAATGEAMVGAATNSMLLEELEHLQLLSELAGNGTWRLQSQIRKRLLQRARADGVSPHVRRTRTMVNYLRRSGLHLQALELAVQENLVGVASAILYRHAEDALWSTADETVARAVDLIEARRGKVPVLFDAMKAEALCRFAPGDSMSLAISILEGPSLDSVVEYFAASAGLQASRIVSERQRLKYFSSRLRSVLGRLSETHARGAARQIALYVSFDLGNPEGGRQIMDSFAISTADNKSPGGSDAAESGYQLLSRAATGDLEAAIRHGENALSLPGQLDQLARARVSNNLALAYASSGDRYRSIQLAMDAAASGKARVPESAITARATVAEIMLIQNRPTAAEAALSRWFPPDSGGPTITRISRRLRPLVVSLAAAASRGSGRGQEALEQASAALELAIEEGVPNDISSCAVEMARCLLTMDMPIESVELLRPVIGRLERSGERLVLSVAQMVAGLATCHESFTASDTGLADDAAQKAREPSSWPAYLSIFCQHPAELRKLLSDDAEDFRRLQAWIGSQRRINELIGDRLEPFVDIRVSVTSCPEVWVGAKMIPWTDLNETRIPDLLLWAAQREAEDSPALNIRRLLAQVYSDLPGTRASAQLRSDLAWLQKLLPDGALSIARRSFRLNAIIDAPLQEELPAVASSQHETGSQLGAERIALTSKFTQELLAQTSVRTTVGGLPADEPWSSLPPRLVRALSHLALGRSNKEISRALGLTEHTVENYVSHLLRETGCTSRTELAITAIAAGVTAPGAKAEPSSSATRTLESPC